MLGAAADLCAIGHKSAACGVEFMIGVRGDRLAAVRAAGECGNRDGGVNLDNLAVLVVVADVSTGELLAVACLDDGGNSSLVLDEKLKLVVEFAKHAEAVGLVALRVGDDIVAELVRGNRFAGHNRAVVLSLVAGRFYGDGIACRSRYGNVFSVGDGRLDCDVAEFEICRSGGSRSVGETADRNGRGQH